MTFVAQQQNKYIIKYSKRTTSFPCVAINWDKFTILDAGWNDQQQCEQNQQTRVPPKYQ